MVLPGNGLSWKAAMYKYSGLNANRIGRVVSMPQWGGGLHRDHLEYLMGVTPNQRKMYKVCLMTAYRRGLICFCGQYVCAVPPVPADRFVPLTK